MAFIRTIPQQEAETDLLALYARAACPESGEVDNILRIHSLHPRGLAAHLELYQAVMAGTRTLRAVDRELIALTVSQLNRCHY